MDFKKINRKQLFLIDGIGALITGSTLLMTSFKFQEYFGLPKKVLVVLSVIAFLFSVYSILCSFLVKNRSKFYLKIIVIMNLCYCFLTIILLVVFFKKLTILGLLYFIVELIVILFLVFLEFRKVKT